MGFNQPEDDVACPGTLPSDGRGIPTNFIRDLT